MKGLSPIPLSEALPYFEPKGSRYRCIRSSREYRVYARFHAFIDILTEAGIVGITDQADQAGPSTIILSPDLPSDWVSPSNPVSITETALSLDSLVLPIEGPNAIGRHSSFRNFPCQSISTGPHALSKDSPQRSP